MNNDDLCMCTHHRDDHEAHGFFKACLVGGCECEDFEESDWDTEEDDAESDV